MNNKKKRLEPVPTRECDCGCKKLYYVTRKDKRYYDRNHAVIGWRQEQRQKKDRA